MLTRYQKAFLEPINLLALAVAGALTPTFGDPMPLFVAGGLEALYLIYVPDSAWYANIQKYRAIAGAREARAKRKREALPKLTPEIRAEFTRIELLYNGWISVQENGVATSETAKEWNDLLDQYLIFALKEVSFSEQRNEIARNLKLDTTHSDEALAAQIYVLLQEEILWLNELVIATQSAPGACSTDARRRIEQVEQRMAYVDQLTKMLKPLREQRSAIESAFVALSNESAVQSGGIAFDTRRSAERLLEQLSDLAPAEQRMRTVLIA